MTREFPKNPEPKIEQPTIGRIVLTYDTVARKQDTLEPVGVGKPMAAIVTDVDGLTINAAVFSGNGVASPVVGLKHISEADTNKCGDLCWDWMPYQKSQARKTEELELKLAGAQGGGGSA